ALNPLIKVMNLVSLLILPAVINLQDNDGARYASAAAALLVLIGAIVFSKRSTQALGEEVAAAGGGVEPGDSPDKLALDALDRWIFDLGDEDHDLRAQLRAAKESLSK
ncbi:MAG: hypothetical protein AB7H43_13645, partial [Acidimicrobiia bacterium]